MAIPAASCRFRYINAPAINSPISKAALRLMINLTSILHKGKARLLSLSFLLSAPALSQLTNHFRSVFGQHSFHSLPLRHHHHACSHCQADQASGSDSFHGGHPHASFPSLKKNGRLCRITGILNSRVLAEKSYAYIQFLIRFSSGR